MCHSDVINTADAVKLSVTLLEESVELSPSGKVQLRLAHNHQEHLEEQSNLTHIMNMSLSHTHWDMITTVSHTHLLLSHYRNQLLHVFSAEGTLAMIVNKRKSVDHSMFNLFRMLLFTHNIFQNCASWTFLFSAYP